MTQVPPKSKSIVRAARAAQTHDDRMRAKAGKTSSTVDSFVNFAQNMGIGADTPMSTASYGFNPITRNRTLLEWVHRGSWVGGLAVDVVADDMTRAGVEFKGALEPEKIQQIEEVATNLGVWNSIADTIKWSRLYGGAIAVLLIDGQDLATPLRLNTIRKGQFCGILPLDRWMVEPSLSDLVTDYGPSLGLPKYYTVTAQAPALSRMRIHYSRCIRLEGVRLPYWQRIMENLWGLSVLERLYDRMVAFDSATTGAAQLVYKSYLRTYKIKDMRQVVAAGGDAMNGLVKYVDMMRRFQGIEGITLIDAEDDLSTETHSAFGGLSDALAQFGQQLSGALQIPLVRLFGQSPAGFSTGETDLRNYYDSIKQWQMKDLHVPITKVYRAIAASEGIELPEGTKLEFNNLWQLTGEQKATIASSVAQAVSQVEEAGLIDRTVALKELKQSSLTTGIFTNITDDMIKEAETEGPPIPEEVEVAQVRAQGVVQAAEVRTESGETPPVKDLAARLRALDSASLAAGVMVVVRGTDRMLLVRRGNGGDFPGTWAIPAGHIEPEETPHDAAKRELWEETGIQAVGELTEVDKRNGFHTFLLIVDKPCEVRLNLESTDYEWASPEKFASQLHPGMAWVLK